MHNVNQKREQLQKKQQNKVKTLCLTMIVKNESRIITRCLDSLKTVVDYVSIVDTGSTDDTVSIIEQWCRDNKIPGKVHHELFKNFGYNRTHAVKMAKKTWPQADYLLLSDADFVWEVKGNFNKKLLFAHKYLIVQQHKDLVYSNIRMLSTQLDWICKCVTHEFFVEDKETCKAIEVTSHLMNSLKIIDLEDGNCKSDKFERDKRLLLAGLEEKDLEEDLRTRYYFYLAQTYKCLGEYENSILFYRKRITSEGWPEEVYYSYYQIGICYQSLYSVYKYLIEIVAKEDKAEHEVQYIAHWNKDNLDVEKLEIKQKECFDLAIENYVNGWKYRPIRGESLNKAAALLREVSEHQRCYDLIEDGLKLTFPTDSLFLEQSAYTWGFWYELSIVAFYLKKFEEGAEACAKVLEFDDLPDHIRSQVEENSKHYI